MNDLAKAVLHVAEWPYGKTKNREGDVVGFESTFPTVSLLVKT
jgi:hypothetical protein